MKLRIWRNSLRLRLSQSEVAQLASGGRVEEAIEFSGGWRLRYAVDAADGARAIGARFEDGLIEVFVLRASARSWAESNDVGLYDDAQLQIAVEKDFRCVTASESENDPDAYPNPAKSC
ncbi:MAG: DUF7009 family protein [Pseudomonadota bacterium]